jgi:hypothetical protein
MRWNEIYVRNPRKGKRFSTLVPFFFILPKGRKKKMSAVYCFGTGPSFTMLIYMKIGARHKAL